MSKCFGTDGALETIGHPSLLPSARFHVLNLSFSLHRILKNLIKTWKSRTKQRNFLQSIDNWKPSDVIGSGRQVYKKCVQYLDFFAERRHWWDSPIQSWLQKVFSVFPFHKCLSTIFDLMHAFGCHLHLTKSIKWHRWEAVTNTQRIHQFGGIKTITR